MPYSFTKIEERKSLAILGAQVFLSLFYFLFFIAWTVFLRMFLYKWFIITEPQTSLGPFSVAVKIQPLTTFDFVFIFIFAVFIALLHFTLASRSAVSNYLRVLRAQPLNPAHPSHQQFQNILDEVAVACGGNQFEGRIVFSSAVNAFALADFDGRQIIGITEGLLYKLKRPQVEAVVGWAAAHILTGAAAEKTIITSLFDLPAETVKSFSWDEDGIWLYATRFSLGATFALAGAIFIYFTGRWLGTLLNIFISRESEYRADAIAVRLTRDPLSLSEALFLSTYNWSGAGVRGENLESIFLVNPAYSVLSEQDNLFADFFATHPPINKRIGILLDMAHADSSILEVSLKNIESRKSAAPAHVTVWLLRRANEWLGPYTQETIQSLDWVKPETFVKKVGDASMSRADDDIELEGILKEKEAKTKDNLYCPKCYTFFIPDILGGKVMLKCRNCEGLLIYENDVGALLEFPHRVYSENISLLAKLVQQESTIRQNFSATKLYTDYLLTCPRCRPSARTMIRQFYSPQYRVQVDKCKYCTSIWFDRNELEVLQFLHLDSQTK